jgi:hypothetical protein
MTARMLQRPIYGGVFGHGNYALATLPTVVNGLHGVRYLVIEPRAGTVLSVSLDKLEAIAAARKLLHLTAPLETAANDSVWEQEALWQDLPFDAQRPPTRVSRRRREIFARSGGHCAYCRTPLTLEGTWHVEHQRPRALGGGDDPVNLVAACQTCNLEKGARTALEFLTRADGEPSR